MSVRNDYKPFTVVPYPTEGAKWCCSCTSGPPTADDTAYIICCAECGNTWGHQDCYQIPEKQLHRKESGLYHFRCFECCSDKTAYHQLLLQNINSCTSVESLLPLLKTLYDLDDIKSVMRKRLNDLDAQQTRSAAFNGLSITELLPDDTLQKMLSFRNLSRNYQVNKAFNRCHRKNLNMLMRRLQRYEDILSFDPPMKYNNIHTVRPRKSRFIYSDYYSTLNSDIRLIDHIKAAKPGDQIALRAGKYGIHDAVNLNGVNMVSHSNVTINLTNTLTVSGNCHIKNITFTSYRSHGVISLKNKSVVHLDGCEFKANRRGAFITDLKSTGSISVIMMNCYFELKSLEKRNRCHDRNWSRVAVKLIGGGSLNLIGCTFAGIKGAAVDIGNANIRGKFINNTFKDNHCSISIHHQHIDNFKYICNRFVNEPGNGTSVAIKRRNRLWF